MKKLLFLISISMYFFSCQPSQEAKEISLDLSKLKAEEKAKDGSEGNSSRKIIKNANVELEVSDIKNADKSIEELVKKSNGYFSNERENKYEDRISKGLTIRIPAKNFELFFLEFDKLDFEVISKEISSTDVTEEFVDVEARLKNRKQVELKYLNLLTKAKSIEDILNIEKAIGELRGEIESTEGRFKALNNQIEYSTINLTYSKLIASKYGFFNRIILAIKQGWESFLSALVFLISLWPYYILLFGAYILFKWMRKLKNK